MKYKAGDEVLVRCKIVGDFMDGYIVTNSVNHPNSNEMCFGFSNRRSIFAHSKEIYPASMEEEITTEEVFETVEKFNCLSSNTLIEIFDTDDIPYILNNLTFLQIKKKIEGWELNQIRVGDVVIPLEGRYREGECGLVVCINRAGQIGVNHPENDFTWFEKQNYLKKTVRHIDINKILKEIGDTDA